MDCMIPTLDLYIAERPRACIYEELLSTGWVFAVCFPSKCCNHRSRTRLILGLPCFAFVLRY